MLDDFLPYAIMGAVVLGFFCLVSAFGIGGLIIAAALAGVCWLIHAVSEGNTAAGIVLGAVILGVVLILIAAAKG